MTDLVSEQDHLMLIRVLCASVAACIRYEGSWAEPHSTLLGICASSIQSLVERYASRLPPHNHHSCFCNMSLKKLNFGAMSPGKFCLPSLAEVTTLSHACKQTSPFKLCCLCFGLSCLGGSKRILLQHCYCRTQDYSALYLYMFPASFFRTLFINLQALLSCLSASRSLVRKLHIYVYYCGSSTRCVPCEF
jgi:hypothetical protein